MITILWHVYSIGVQNSPLPIIIVLQCSPIGYLDNTVDIYRVHNSPVQRLIVEPMTASRWFKEIPRADWRRWLRISQAPSCMLRPSQGVLWIAKQNIYLDSMIHPKLVEHVYNCLYFPNMSEPMPLNHDFVFVFIMDVRDALNLHLYNALIGPFHTLNPSIPKNMWTCKFNNLPLLAALPSTTCQPATIVNHFTNNLSMNNHLVTIMTWS